MLFFKYSTLCSVGKGADRWRCVKGPHPPQLWVFPLIFRYLGMPTPYSFRISPRSFSIVSLSNPLISSEMRRSLCNRLRCSCVGGIMISAPSTCGGERVMVGDMLVLEEDLRLCYVVFLSSVPQTYQCWACGACRHTYLVSSYFISW